MSRIFALSVVLSASFASAAPPRLKTNVDDLPWSERASFFVGARTGVAVPPGAVGLAPNAGLEVGFAVPKGFGFSLRGLWMNSPPGVPFLGLRPSSYGFGAMADFRYYFRTIEPLTVYPTLAVGFLAGPEVGTNVNAVLPLFNPGVGMKVKAGNFYGSFEFGLSGFTIPFVAVGIGFDGDSLFTRRKAAAKSGQPLPQSDDEVMVEPEAPAPAPTPAPLTEEQSSVDEFKQPSAMTSR